MLAIEKTRSESAGTIVAAYLFLQFPYLEKIRHCPKQAKCSNVCQLKSCFISDTKRENTDVSKIRLSQSMLSCVLALL